MVQVTVFVPAALRQYAAGERKVRVEVDGDEPPTVGHVFSCLHKTAPGVVERALDECGEVRPHVNVFVDGELVRVGLQLGLDTPVAEGAEVWILPAVSGG